MVIFTENSLLQNNILTFFYQHVNNSLRAQLISPPLLSEDFPQASIYRVG